ncbi:hypothetical protein BASA60_007645 [Batrachochytrium salamandrivorans]|nr:hypothetical protein BASA60_007645 [Batrachochytrium salamandrivorans]
MDNIDDDYSSGDEQGETVVIPTGPTTVQNPAFDSSPSAEDQAAAAATAAKNTPAAQAALAAQQSRLQCRMRRIRSIQKLIRVGRNEVVVVLRVDKEKGYIDLSKRRVSAEDVAKCEERFNKSKSVHGIVRHVAEKLSLRLEDIYTQVVWPLYKKFGHAYEAFKLAITEPDSVFAQFDLPLNVKRELVGNIRRRLTPQAIKIRADIECTCFGYEGIDAIKAALLAGEACSTTAVPIKIKLVAPPLYVMITNSLEKVEGVETLEKAIATIEDTLKTYNGSLVVKMKPRAVSETDDAELAQLMAKMERENAEISGDDDAEGDAELD